MTSGTNVIERGGGAVAVEASPSSAAGPAPRGAILAAAASSRVRYKKPKRSMTPYSECWFWIVWFLFCDFDFVQFMLCGME